MGDDIDPFRNCEALRGKIRDPETSFFRDLDIPALADSLREQGLDPGWLHPDDVREATRHAALEGWRGRDLWVFAYGSLMWDPGILFTDVRYARVTGYARRFCLYDDKGGRGDRETPGLMAALDLGHHCDGLAFLVAADRLEDETERLWRREMIGPAYVPAFVPMTLDGQTVPALTFTADHAARDIRTDLSHAEKVRLIATGKGTLGTSLEYIENLARHLDALGLDDDEVTSLLRDAHAFTP
jgi:cation transport protein ChaC